MIYDNSAEESKELFRKIEFEVDSFIYKNNKNPNKIFMNCKCIDCLNSLFLINRFVRFDGNKKYEFMGISVQPYYDGKDFPEFYLADNNFTNKFYQ